MYHKFLCTVHIQLLKPELIGYWQKLLIICTAGLEICQMWSVVIFLSEAGGLARDVSQCEMWFVISAALSGGNCWKTLTNNK